MIDNNWFLLWQFILLVTRFCNCKLYFKGMLIATTNMVKIILTFAI